MIALGNWIAAQKPVTNQFNANSAKVEVPDGAVVCVTLACIQFADANQRPAEADRHVQMNK